MSDEAPSNGSEFGLGVLLGIGLHFAFVAACMFLEYLTSYSFSRLVLLLAGTQWLYIYPAVVILRRKEQFDALQGLLFVAVLTMVFAVIGFLVVAWNGPL